MSSGQKTFLFSYRYGDAEWALEIPAQSAHEARERLRCIPFARYDGEVVAKVPAGAGPIARLAVWLRNVSRPT